MADAPPDTGEIAQLRGVLAQQQAQLEQLRQLEAKLPKGMVPETRDQRIARENAAGQVAPPTTMDKLKTALDPAAVDQDIGAGLRSMAGGLTMGASDAVNDATGGDNPQARAAREAESPVTTAITRGAGGTVGALGAGPTAALGRGAQGLLGMAEQRVPALANTALGRIAGQGAAGAATGAVTNAAQTAIADKSLANVPAAAGEGALSGGLMGAGLQGGSEVAGAAARGLANTGAGKAAEILKSPPGQAPEGLTAEQTAAAKAGPPTDPREFAGHEELMQLKAEADAAAAAHAEKVAAYKAAEDKLKYRLPSHTGPTVGLGYLGHALHLPFAMPVAGALASGSFAATNAAPLVGRALLPAAQGARAGLSGLGQYGGLLQNIEADVADARAKNKKRKGE